MLPHFSKDFSIIYKLQFLQILVPTRSLQTHIFALGSVLPSGSWGGKGVGGPMHKYTHTILLQVSYQ